MLRSFFSIQPFFEHKKITAQIQSSSGGRALQVSISELGDS
jgi:hypothetical protein